MDFSNVQEMLVSQGKNVLTSMQNLTYHANKKGQERADLYQKFTANSHSFRVYTYYIDGDLEEVTEIQQFLDKIELFNELFFGVGTELDKNVDVTKVKEALKEASNGYEEMVNALKLNQA